MAKVAVILSGCGVFDGSEIHEAVLTLLALDRAGAQYQCLAPNKNQADVINHVTRQPMKETRNVLVESARIARGNIKDLATASADEYDAVILPGGYGAAKNLCTFAEKGERCELDPALAKFLQAMYRAGKPIGAICISPVLLARAFGRDGAPRLTIGKDPDTANKIEQMGADHVSCPVDDFVVDEENRMVTTPAYMLARSIREAAEGIEKLVHEVLRLARTPRATTAGKR
ncbi:MAG: isoprenoid biosynthesis protein ElbB [Gemmataceae bacterium]